MVLSEVYIERSNYLSPGQVDEILNESIFGDEVSNYLMLEKEIDSFVANQIMHLLENEIKENEQFRNKIIQIKRKIFNGKTITKNCINYFVTNDAKNSVLTYLKMLEKKQKIFVSLEQHYLDKKNKEYIQVKKLFKETSIYDSLIMTNKNIKISLDRFLKNDKMDKKDRKVYVRLVSFLTRAAKKCSPLGNLTLSTIHGLDNDPSSQNIFVRVNYALLTKWWALICKTDTIRESKKYILSPLLRTNQNKIYNTILINSDQGYLTNTKVQIKGYSSFLSQYLFSQKPITYSNFHHQFRKELDEKSLKKIWNYLIDEHLLILESTIEEKSDNYLELIIEESSKYPELNDIAEMFLNLFYSTVELEKEFTLKNLERVENDLQLINKVLPINNFFEINHIYFDYVQSTKEQDETIFDYQDLLYKIQLILLAFDPEVKRKILIGDAFKKLYPEGIEGKEQILTALKRIGEDPSINDPFIMNMYFSKYDFNHHFENPRVNELHSISSEIINLFNNQSFDEHHLKINIKKIELFEDRIKKLIPDYREYSQNIFAQIQENSMVLNHLYPGQGMFFNRFIKYFKPDLQRMYSTKQLSNTCDKDVIDIEGVFGFNANIRYSLTNKTLTLPYYNSVNGSLSLNDLKMIYNESTQTIQFNNKVTRVRPLFLGTLVITAVPVPIGILNTLGSNSAPLSNYFEMLFDLKDYFSHLPRISFFGTEKEVIVNREKWRIKTTLFGELKVRDFDSWISIQKFFKEHNIPPRFYVRNGKEKDFSSFNEKNSFKPQFINILSPASVDLLIKILSSNQYLIIEEEFPVTQNNQVAHEYILESSITHSSKSNILKRRKNNEVNSTEIVHS